VLIFETACSLFEEFSVSSSSSSKCIHCRITRCNYVLLALVFNGMHLGDQFWRNYCGAEGDSCPQARPARGAKLPHRKYFAANVSMTSLSTEPKVAYCNKIVLFQSPICLGSLRYPTAWQFTFRTPAVPPPQPEWGVHSIACAPVHAENPIQANAADYIVNFIIM